MKILLIQPRMSATKTILKEYIDRINYKLFFSSFTLEQLSGIIPKEHDVTIIDEKIGKKINFNDSFDLVGISAFTSNVNRGYEIALEFRKRGVPVIMGGYHPSALPDEAIRFCDSVAVGESEYLWPKILDDVRNGKLKPFYIQDKPVDANDIPSCRSEQTRGSYLVGGIQATRGCSNRCEFCAITNMKYGSLYRKRPINKVIEEIKSTRQKIIDFFDPSFTVDTSYTKSLFKELKGIDKTFTANGNINILFRDEELLKLASEAGIRKWFIGFESFNQKNLDMIGKKANRVEEYAAAIRKIRDYDMDVYGLFMVGLDHDILDVFDSTAHAILYDLELTNANIYVSTPFPGTPLFTRLDKEGRILTKDWSRYTMDDVVIKPKNMSPEELFEGYKRAKREIHSLLNVLKHPRDLYFHIFYS